MEAVAIVTALKLLMFQIDNFALFIGYRDVGVMVKVSKWECSNTTGNHKEAVNKTVKSTKNL